MLSPLWRNLLRRKEAMNDSLIRTLALIAIAVALWIAVIWGFNI